MSGQSLPRANQFESAQKHLQQLREALNSAIVGQQVLIDELITAFFARGHVLLEGLPGLGKTHLAKGIARCIGVDMRRIQCTPDLMPSDATGIEVLNEGVRGEGRFEFLPGPLFANMVLVDEINRAAPKTQSALLEAMQEQQVTVLGTSHALPSPFWVLATQNPIELEGTYPLPEAQLDRFMFKLLVKQPTSEAMLALLNVSLDEEPTSRLEQVLALQQAEQIMRTAQQVMIAQPLKRAAVELVMATQPGDCGGQGEVCERFRFGAGPRGLQSLVRAARVRALLCGRTHVSREDLAAVALPVLRHRVLLTIESQIHGVDVDSVLSELIKKWSHQR